MNDIADHQTKKIVSTRIFNGCKIVKYEDGSEWISPIEQPNLLLKQMIEAGGRKSVIGGMILQPNHM